MEQSNQPNRRNPEFWEQKTIEELAREQGKGPVNLDEVIGRGAHLWTSDEEFEQFLRDATENQPSK